MARKRMIWVFVLAVVLTAIMSIGVTLAATTGGLDPSGGPAEASSQMYTLEQIYQRLTTGNYYAAQSGFMEPASGPGPTMQTLDEIMAVAQPRALAPRVAKTGQTQCYESGGNVTDCAGTGQDGEYQRGIDPVIAPTGGPTGAYNTPAWTGVRFTDNGDGTVTDNLTALIWLKNANCFGVKNWATALSDANGLAASNCGLSDGSSAGDWRLPNVNELHSLVDLTQNNPALPTGHPFDGVQSFFYWSSTSFAGYTDYAWSVGLDGGVGGNGKASTVYVWPVRGGQ